MKRIGHFLVFAWEGLQKTKTIQHVSCIKCIMTTVVRYMLEPIVKSKEIKHYMPYFHVFIILRTNGENMYLLLSSIIILQIAEDLVFFLQFRCFLN